MKKSERMKLAMRVRMYRARFKMSQREFGELFGVTRMSISFIENGQWEEVSDDLVGRVKTHIGLDGNFSLSGSSMVSLGVKGAG